LTPQRQVPVLVAYRHKRLAPEQLALLVETAAVGQKAVFKREARFGPTAQILAASQAEPAAGDETLIALLKTDNTVPCGIRVRLIGQRGIDNAVQRDAGLRPRDAWESKRLLQNYKKGLLTFWLWC
jgi:hypothetical protein